MSPTSLVKCTGRTWFRAAFVFALGVLSVSIAQGAATVPLGRAADFAVLAASAVSNTSTSLITGDVGVSPGTVALGFPPGRINGLLHTGNVASADAQADLTIAFLDAGSRTPTPLGSELGGLTLTGGVYSAVTPLEIITSDLILNGRGDPNSVFIFQGDSLIIAPARRVILTNSARAGRIFWQLNGPASVGVNSILKGNILADGSITIENGANLEGRALSRTGDVSIDTAVVRLPAAGSGAAPSGFIVVESQSAIVLNPQTGLMEQTIRVRNAGSNAVEAARVWMKNLPPNVTVYNATGKTVNRHPFVQYNLPLLASDSVDLVIEYLRPNRLPFASPGFFTNTPARLSFAAPVGQHQTILRRLPMGTRMLVEFATRPGRQYAVQYSDDGRIWKTARPLITANADRLFWVDYGAPKTEGAPPSNRKYRVVQLF